MRKEINVVIGSWGSYNACTSRAFGSEWLTLNDFNEWEEIEKELVKQGFELEGIDEELFIQDIEGVYSKNINWDYMNPRELFEVLKKAEVFNYDFNISKMNAFIELEGWREFKERVEKRGEWWDDDIYFYEDTTPGEAMRESVESNYDVRGLDWLLDYIDWDEVANNEGVYHETECGTLEIY